MPQYASAEDLVVPAPVAVKLIGGVASYERNFAGRAARAGGRVAVAILSKRSDADSERAAFQIEAAFRDLGPIASFPHEQFIVPWADASAFVAVCLQQKVTIAYLPPGFHREAKSIANALAGSGVLLVAGSLAYVSDGAVLGLDLVSGRPKIVINLSVAKREGMSFRSALLRLARVVE